MTVRDRRSTSHFHRSGLRRIAPPTMPSADFSAAITGLTTRSVRSPGHAGDSPEVRSTAFTARPPDLPPRSLMAVDFAITCSLVRPGRPRYPVLVHRAAALLHASFRPRLTALPLRFANPSPPSGRVKDLHLQAVDHARHTKKRRAGMPRAAPNSNDRRYQTLMVLTVVNVFAGSTFVTEMYLLCTTATVFS